ncbi:toprim domain-containing protein [Vibrio navarrensis]|nr:toprim domain-containing protein [Vibrio navarrensis]
MSQSKVAVVKAAAEGRWLEIFKAIAPNLKDAVDNIGNHVPCPLNGGTDGFRLFPTANDKGDSVSNLHGIMQSGFDTLMFALNKNDFTYVLNEVADYLGLSGNEWKGAQVSPTVVKAEPKIDLVKLKKCRYALRKAWQSAFDLTAPEAKLARQYLAKRGFDLKKLNLHCLSKTVRFNPSMPLYETRKIGGEIKTIKVGYFPAIVSLVTYPHGKAATIHRTYLDHCGNKLNMVVEGVEVNAKKIMSRCEPLPLTGSAIHLYESKGEVLHVAEGIETALAVKQVLASRKIDEPVWACISTTIMENLQPPKGVKYLFIWADKDIKRLINDKWVEPGLDAAMTLAENLEESDVWPVIMYPTFDIPEGRKSIDWNDVLVEHGETAFPHHHLQVWKGAC